MAEPEPPDSIAANVAEWTETNAQFTDAQAEDAWAPQDLTWGVFGRGNSRQTVAVGCDQPTSRATTHQKEV